jgi:hypothetical protein
VPFGLHTSASAYTPSTMSGTMAAASSDAQVAGDHRVRAPAWAA